MRGLSEGGFRKMGARANRVEKEPPTEREADGLEITLPRDSSWSDRVG